MSPHDRHSRRQFLARTVAAASTLQLASAVGPIDDRLDPQALATLRARLKGGVIVAADAGYDAARRIHFWNAGTERRPALIARCAAADDVRHAVEFAHTHGLDLAVRGGGHSPMGW